MSHSVDLLKKLEVLPLIHLVKYKTAMFIYNVFHDYVPTNITIITIHNSQFITIYHNSLILCCKSSYLCNSADLFKKLEVLPLFHLVKYKTAIFVYKVFCDLVPTNILSHFTHIVCNSSYLCNSADMFKKLEVLPLLHLVKYKTAISMYKEFCDIVPTNILSHFIHIVCKRSYLCNSADLFKKLEVYLSFT